MAADVLCPATGAGGEAAGIPGDAAEYLVGAGQRKVPGNAAKRQLPGAWCGTAMPGQSGSSFRSLARTAAITTSPVTGRITPATSLCGGCHT